MPVTNFVILDALLQRHWAVLGDALRHLILPAVALATIPLAVITRMTRASLLEALRRTTSGRPAPRASRSWP